MESRTWNEFLENYYTTLLLYYSAVLLLNCSTKNWQLEWGPAASKAATASAWATATTGRWTARTTRATELVVFALRLLPLGKGGEAVGEGEHAIASQRVVDGVLDVACRLGAADVLLLAQDVVDRELYRCLLSREELIGDRAVPNPLLGVVACAVARGGAEVEVGAYYQSKWCRVNIAPQVWTLRSRLFCIVL